MHTLLFKTKKATAFLALCLLPKYFACVHATEHEQRINQAAAKFIKQSGAVKTKLADNQPDVTKPYTIKRISRLFPAYHDQGINDAAAKFKRQRRLVRKQLGLADFYQRDDDEASGNVFYTILGGAAGTFVGFHALNLKITLEIIKGTIHNKEDLKKWVRKNNTNVMLTIGGATFAGAMLYTTLTYSWKWYTKRRKLPPSANNQNMHTNQLAQAANAINHTQQAQS